MPGTIAGLYQVNVQLPSTTASSGTFHTMTGATPTTLLSPVQLPVVVTSNGRSSQAGVSIWATPSLKVEPIAADVLSNTFTFTEAGTVGQPWCTASCSTTASIEERCSPIFCIVSPRLERSMREGEE